MEQAQLNGSLRTTLVGTLWRRPPTARVWCCERQAPAWDRISSRSHWTAIDARTPLVRTAFNEQNGEISPDGKWLAYEWDESGRLEIYVRPHPSVDAGRWPVTTSGGRQPLWARSSRELFYRAPNGAVMGVTTDVVTSGARTTSLSASTRRCSWKDRITPAAARFLAALMVCLWMAPGF